jgi:hypothetical protein
MVWRNIYEGPKSCYALREGIYVPGRGVNLKTGISILYMILRDYRRGKTYNHSCEVIPMTERLFVRRANYLIPLCKKHGTDPLECRALKKIVKYVIKHKKLPSEAERYVRIAETGKPVAKPVIAVPHRRKRVHKVRRAKVAWI